MCEVENPVPWLVSKKSIDAVQSITSQSWFRLGEGDLFSSTGVIPPSSAEEIIQNIYYMLLIRVVAILSCRNPRTGGQRYFRAADVDENVVNEYVPIEIQEELYKYICQIALQYRNVHYHSMFHAYHVVISANKLLDICLDDDRSEEHITTFGIKSNPLLQLSLMFSALIHDVDHQGISNMQLVEEEDELAILYNDQSVAEQQSLAIAFRTLATPNFSRLKKLLFQDTAEYRFFRKTVIDLVLSTDVASPERMQIVKSKWKEAFGETTEHKVYKKLLESEIQQNVLSNRGRSDSISLNPRANGGDTNHARRFTMTSFFDRRSMIALSLNNENNEESNEADEDYVSISPCESSCEDDIDADSETNVDSSPLPLSLGVRNRNIYVSNNDEPEDPSKVALLEDPHPSTVRHSSSTSESVLTDSILSFSSAGSNRRVSIEQKNSLRKRGSMDEYLDTEYDLKSNIRAFNRLDSIESVDSDGKNRKQTNNSDSKGTKKNLRFVNIADNDSVSSNGKGSVKNSKMKSRDFSRRSSNESLQHVDFPIFRRSSAPAGTSVRPRSSEVRLGIRRAMDLTGNSIEQYARSTHDAILKSVRKDIVVDIEILDDEPDEFRASVVLETMLRAADVAANMQCWKTMLKWSSRLYFEQMATFETGRMNSDPSSNWFDNQIKFLDSYVIPLARRMDDMGVFGELGQQFAAFALENRRQWIEEGSDFTSWMVRRWIKIKDKKKLSKKLAESENDD